MQGGWIQSPVRKLNIAHGQKTNKLCAAALKARQLQVEGSPDRVCWAQHFRQQSAWFVARRVTLVTGGMGKAKWLTY